MSVIRASSPGATSWTPCSARAGWPRSTWPPTACWTAGRGEGAARRSTRATRPSSTRFRREAQAAAALDDPHVVKVYDTGSTTGTYFIVMEYVRGKTLAASSSATRRRSPPQSRGGSPATSPRRWPSRTPGARPPRHQAGEHHDHARRRGQGDGLRHRPGDPRGERHADRDRAGDRDLLLAGTGSGADRRRAFGHLLARRGALRDADAQAALRRGDGGGCGVQARHRGRRPADTGRGDDPRAARGHRHAVPGEEPGEPVSDRAGVGPGPRPVPGRADGRRDPVAAARSHRGGRAWGFADGDLPGFGRPQEAPPEARRRDHRRGPAAGRPRDRVGGPGEHAC